LRHYIPAALLIGLEQFPEATYLQILYGNFLISIMKDSAMGGACHSFPYGGKSETPVPPHTRGRVSLSLVPLAAQVKLFCP
jgi:hypothetical protein